jgi:hypothetical protein
MIGYVKTTKALWYKTGGFANPLNVRVTRNGAWAYYRLYK